MEAMERITVHKTLDSDSGHREGADTDSGQIEADCFPGSQQDGYPLSDERSIVKQTYQVDFFTKRDVTAQFSYHRGIYSEDSIQKLKDAFEMHSSLNYIFISDPLQDDCLLPLLTFIQQKTRIQRIRSCTREGMACLEVSNSYQSDSTFYYIKKIDGHVHFLSPSEMLREDLMEWLEKNSVPSAIAVSDNRLVFFMTKDHPKIEPLVSRIQDVKNSYKIESRIFSLPKQLRFIPDGGFGKRSPGCQIEFHCSAGKTFFATAGAFVKDEADKLYILSSCHGITFQDCYFIEAKDGKKHKCEYVAGVFQQRPFLDACLLRVTSQELKKKYEWWLPGSDKKKMAFYGPYANAIEDLSETPGQRPGVMKYGGSTKLTKGELAYYKFNAPAEGITGGLIITPAKDKGVFSWEGDSGGVIVRETTDKTHELKDTSFHEAIAMHSNAVEGFLTDQTCSLAFRLDHVIKHFEGVIGIGLKILP